MLTSIWTDTSLCQSTQMSAFSVSAPKVWNSLPYELRSVTDEKVSTTIFAKCVVFGVRCVVSVDGSNRETKALTELGFVGGDRYGFKDYWEKSRKLK